MLPAIACRGKERETGSSCLRRSLALVRLRGRCQHQPAILHRNTLARIEVHAHLVRLLAQAILDVVADDLLAGVVHGLTARLHHRGGVALLCSLLDFVTRVAACSCARRGGNLPTVTAADLAAEH